jgi:hypothetical protein
MGRRRKTPSLRFHTVSSDGKVSGGQRAIYLASEIKKRSGRRGRPLCVDQLRAGMFAADQCSPTPAGTKRQTPNRGSPVTPRREKRAAELLQRILQPPGAIKIAAEDRRKVEDKKRMALEQTLIEAILLGNRGNTDSAVEALHNLDRGRVVLRRGKTHTAANLTRIVEQGRGYIKNAQRIPVH